MSCTRGLSGLLTIGLFLAASAGCSSPVAPGDVQLTALTGSTDASGDIRGEATFVARDAETFDRLWREFFGALRGVPAVDFSRHMVVIATMGQQPTGGYAIEIARVTASRGSGLTVQVRTTSPGPSCPVTMMLTTPVVVSRVTRVEGPVHFEFTRTTRDCAGR